MALGQASVQWIRCHLGCPSGLESRFWFRFQLPADAHPGRKQMIVQVIGSLPCTWEIRTEFHSQFWPELTLAVVGAWRVDQQMIAYSLAQRASLSLCM